MAKIFAIEVAIFLSQRARRAPRAQNTGAARATRWQNNRERPVASPDKRDISPSDKFPR
jgi:hypothetical protein